MVVKMKTSMSGPSVSYLAGKEYDLPDGKAQRFLDNDLAEAVEDKVVISKAREKSDFRNRKKER